MEIQTLELTEEDILDFHRYYITCLFLEDRKTAVEIVGLLYERSKLQVTVSQVERCIREWRLELPLEVDLHTDEPTTPSDDSWILIPSMRISPAQVSTNISYTPSDPNLMSLYTKRPLPSLPSPKPSPKADSKSRIRKKQPPSTDKLRATCHHGTGISESHEVETNLREFPDGPSQLQLYVDDDQSHERLAMRAGLDISGIALIRLHAKEGMARRQAVPRRRLPLKDKRGIERGTDRQSPESPSS